MNASERVVIYTDECCPISAGALARLHALLAEYPEVDLAVRPRVTALQYGDLIVATPTIVFPNGMRMVGTPDPSRVRGIMRVLRGIPHPVPNKVWYLEQNRLFRGVPQAEIAAMAHLFRESDHPPRQIIFGEGDLGDAIYLLKTGHVRIYRLTEEGKELTLAMLGPGDVFGELALFDESRRMTFAQTLDPAHICAASIDDFMHLMSHRPSLTMMVAREMARRRTEAETRVAGMAYSSVRGKLVVVLAALVAEHGVDIEGGGKRIALRLSHQELANLAGTSRESCTIELGKLQRAGLVTIDEQHRYIIPHPERLEPGAFDRFRRALLAPRG